MYIVRRFFYEAEKTLVTVTFLRFVILSTRSITALYTFRIKTMYPLTVHRNYSLGAPVVPLDALRVPFQNDFNREAVRYQD